jgi:hypothetical protein
MLHFKTLYTVTSVAFVISTLLCIKPVFAKDLPVDAERYGSVASFLEHGNQKENHYSGLYLRLSPEASGRYKYLLEGKKKLQLKDKAFMVSRSGLFYKVEQKENGEYWISISSIYQDKLDGIAALKSVKLV